MCHAEKMELCCSKRQIKLPGIQWTQQPRYLPFPIPIFSPDDTARKGDWVLCLPCLPILSVLHLPHLALRLPRASRVVRGSRQAAGRVWVCELTQERMAPPPPASHLLPKLAERGLGGLCQQGQAHERGRCQCRACRTGTHVALGQSTLGTSMRTGTNLVYTPDSLFSACRS